MLLYIMLYIPGGDNLVKGVQCYELFGGIALKNHTFSYIVLAYLMLFAALTNAVCSNNASFFFH